ncbi:hypothetical protein HAX54_052600, partial [Datura stramonium]|nr:hypothetical protein [Datura stramonium]
DIGVDISNYPVKDISSTYNDRAFASMRYVLDDRQWYKTASYRPKIKLVVAKSSSRTSSDDDAFDAPVTEIQEVKLSLNAVVGDLHRCNDNFVQ